MAFLIDTTLRDGAQAHWSGRLTTEQVLPVVLSMDKAGFHAMDFMAGLQFEISVKFLNENPWEKVRAVRRVVRHTPLITHIRSRSLVSFDLQPIEAIRLYIERAAANGFRRIMIFDALHDIENMKPSIAHAREVGLHVTAVIFFTISPFHTDEYYGRVAATYAELGADSVCLRDPSGLLTVERTRTLIPILRKALGSRQLELKSHCSTGLAPACYIEAIKAGVDTLFTATSPLANGPSVPATEAIVADAQEAGIGISVDLGRVADAAEYFRDLAAAEGRPLGRVVEGDSTAQYRHQVPGGMLVFLRDQLRNLGKEDRLPEVLEEIPRVREDMGFPVMVTPISQLVGVQAVLNVMNGRYVLIPNEVRRYVAGHYGRPEGPLGAELVDRVTAEGVGGLEASEEEGIVERVRRELGPFESDDDLILHIMFHGEQLRNIPPYNRRGMQERAQPLDDISALIKVLRDRRRLGYISISTGSLDFTVSRQAQTMDGVATNPEGTV